jgi:hypothetical protein
MADTDMSFAMYQWLIILASGHEILESGTPGRTLTEPLLVSSNIQVTQLSNLHQFYSCHLSVTQATAEPIQSLYSYNII